MVAEASEQQEVTGSEAIGYIDSVQFREKFLRKAEAEGILTSRTKVAPLLPEPAIRPVRHRGYTAVALGVAAPGLAPKAPEFASRTAREPPCEKIAPPKSAPFSEPPDPEPPVTVLLVNVLL